VVASGVMAHKTSIILLVLALAPGCEKKSSEKKAEEPAATASAPAPAPDPGSQPAPGTAPAAGETPPGNPPPPAGEPDKVASSPEAAKPTKTLVVTVGLGAKDLAVQVAGEKGTRPMSMNPTSLELDAIAATAKAAPDASEGAVLVAVGDSVPQASVMPLVDALKAAGFKKVSVSVSRKP